MEFNDQVSSDFQVIQSMLKKALEREKLLAKKIFAIMQRKCFSMTLEKFHRGEQFCSKAEKIQFDENTRCVAASE